MQWKCYVDFERLYGEGRQHYKQYAEHFACKLALLSAMISASLYYGEGRRDYMLDVMLSSLREDQYARRF